MSAGCAMLFGSGQLHMTRVGYSPGVGSPPGQWPYTKRAAATTRHRSAKLFGLSCPGCSDPRVETSFVQLVIAVLPRRVCRAAGSHSAAWHTLFGGETGEYPDPARRPRRPA